MRNIITILSVLFAHILFSQQDSAWLNVNNVKALILNENKLFTGKNYHRGFYFPKNANQSTIFYANIWLKAFRANGDTCIAAHKVGPRLEAQDFFYGPVFSNPQIQGFDFFRQVFPIHKSLIDTHIVDWSNSNSQPLPDSIIHNELKMWPAKGNPFVKSIHGIEITQNMAPFIDVNSDGNYTPNQGDYPDVCGDMAIYWIMNDANHPHTETSGKPLGIEIHALAYAFQSATQSIANTVFFSYNFINKSNQDLINFQMAQFADFDIGNSPDDFFGCDSLNNLFYTYQADQFDEPANGIGGYDTLKPSASCLFLNKQIYAARHLGFEISGPPTNIPFNTQYVHWSINGNWADGLPTTIGGNGYGGNTDETKFLYGGNPSDNQKWSECSSGSVKGDRKSLGSITPQNLPKDSSMKVDLAFINVLNNNSLCKVDSQFYYAQEVKTFYNSNLLNCPTVKNSNGTVVIASVSDLQSPINFTLHPNPAITHFTITTPHNLTGNTLTIHNTIGQQVATHTIPSNHSIPLNQLPKGIYYIQTNYQTTPIKTKLIIQ